MADEVCLNSLGSIQKYATLHMHLPSGQIRHMNIIPLILIPDAYLFQVYFVTTKR